MSRFVLDASVALAWCFEDEASAAADRVLETLKRGAAVVPAQWPIEVANALLAGERRKRIAADASARFIGLLSTLPIEVAPPHSIDVRDLLALARLRRLAAYDAEYLALALREGLPLASLDARLATAARTAGVKMLN